MFSKQFRGDIIIITITIITITITTGSMWGLYLVCLSFPALFVFVSCRPCGIIIIAITIISMNLPSS